MSLSSIIVQREVASIREIEEALARQVLYGGDFVTNLLEVSRIEESALMPVVADSFGLSAAPIGELPPVPAEATRLVAAEVAAERVFAPIEVGSTLVVAVAEPFSRDVEQELTFALALPIEQRIAPMFRIRQALARDYGVPLDKRVARLITKVVSKGPRIASTFPPPMESQPRLPARPPSVAPPPAALPDIAPITTAAAQGTLVRKAEAPPARPIRRRRGPLTADIAKQELEASGERDVIFDILFEFARQFFDYTALFIVHGELAEGRDAFGDGAAREKVARVGVPLDLPNLLADARKAKALHRAKPAREGLDPILMADLGRDGATECVVFPIIVRSRVVALLFGDGGLAGVDDVGVRQVEMLVEASAGAFERVIVRRKLKAGEKPAERGVAAARRNSSDSLVPPPTQVSAPPPESVEPPIERPSIEELAPPIRELMNEPLSSAAGSTARQPTANALLAIDPQQVRSDRPPPENLLVVRKPTGAPIPREEPDAGRTGSQPPRFKSGGFKRAEAPPLEFGVPSMPSVITESAFGAEPEERALLQQIQGPSARPVSSDVPATTRDVPPWDARPLDASVAPSAGHPWGQEHSPGPPLALPVDPPAARGPDSQSPRALSPPPMPVTTSTTDMSPQPIDFGPQVKKTPAPQPQPPPPPAQVSYDPITGAPRTPKRDLSATLVEGMPMFPPPSGVTENAKPVAPLIIVTPDSEMPVQAAPESQAPPSGDVASTSDPILSLAQRKGMPPVVTTPEPKVMPPSEQQVSVPLHKPPSSRSDHSRVLPSVIVDVANEYTALVDRVLAGPDDDAETQLLRAGGYAMPAIMTRFPGPIALEIERLDGPLPRVGECGPILRLVASQRRTALPFVLSHLVSTDVERRFWATYLLTELVYPDSVDPGVSRVFDEEPRVRRAALSAVRALAEAHPALVVERLGGAAHDPREITLRRCQAIEGLGETREPSAIPMLLPLLEDPEGDVRNAARAALVVAARQDFGLDGGRWSAWWDANKERHRLEWLIDSLMHESRLLRGQASDELRAITKEYFAYYDDLPKRERERAQARYREWWEQTGKVRFGKSALRG